MPDTSLLLGGSGFCTIVLTALILVLAPSRGLALPIISVNDILVSEAAGVATFTVSLTESSTQLITVEAQTFDGTATSSAPVDYQMTTGQLTFTPGNIQIPFTVSIIDDLVIETNETFSVVLSNPTGIGASIGDDEGIATILDNDQVSSPIPEPTTMLLLGSGLVGLVGFRRKFKNLR